MNEEQKNKILDMQRRNNVQPDEVAFLYDMHLLIYGHSPSNRSCSGCIRKAFDAVLTHISTNA